MAKVLITINPKTDSLIDKYQALYRELNGAKISRSYVINKVFEESKEIPLTIKEMEEVVEKRKQLTE